MMKLLKIIWVWMFKRLPIAFSVPMLTLLLLYFALLYPWLTYRAVPLLSDLLVGYLGLGAVGGVIQFMEFVSSLVIVMLALLGIILSYNLATALYALWRPKPMPKLMVHDPVYPENPESNSSGDGRLQNCNRIGIILAGGGAKGAYQAGAMKAIHEFLEEHNALSRVKMIAGTSIGSWNALFWLADLIKGPATKKESKESTKDDNKGHTEEEMSLHEQWWSRIDASSVIRPAFYLPFVKNYFLSNEPWQDMFERIFVDNDKAYKKLRRHAEKPDEDGSIHFFFTRSNVARGHLEFSSNRTDLSDVPEHLASSRRPRPPVPRDRWKVARAVKDIKEAVFASMDLPPLFKYMNIGDETFEDGGVVDNLPIRFGTEIENCDLLFVLPLNSSFTQNPDTKLVSKRLFRVMDVRQGVLERNSFKMVYLYNELAGLRGRIGAGVSTISQPAVASGETNVDRALRRKHSAVKVFTICPGPELIIDTSEFWKTEEAGRAYRLMHEYTRYALEDFDFNADQDWIKMPVVGPHGEVTWVDDF